jgi:pimeloyl-ACP methyl ester carboxylesterase
MIDEAVLLLHGLWMNRLVMQYLAWRLAQDGYATHTLGYPSMAGGLQENATRLSEAVRVLPEGRIHLLGHSLGGLVVMRYLEGQVDARVGRTVLLGSPIGGSQAGRHLDEHALTRMLLGHSAEIWRAPPAWRVRGEVGMIAGTGRIGLGRLLAPLEGENDGVVRLEETRIPGLADHIVLPVSHSTMLVSPEVAAQAAAFFRTGRFERGAAR